MNNLYAIGQYLGCSRSLTDSGHNRVVPSFDGFYPFYKGFIVTKNLWGPIKFGNVLKVVSIIAGVNGKFLVTNNHVMVDMMIDNSFLPVAEWDIGFSRRTTVMLQHGQVGLIVRQAI